MVLGLLAGCGPEGTPTPAPGATAEGAGATVESEEGERTLTVMTHDSFDVSDEVVAAFQEACNCQVQFLRSGDAGLMLNQALLSRGNPLADVIYGVDNTFLSRALEGDILEPYESPVLARIDDDLELDPSYHMLPVDYGDVCLNYDKAWFEEQGLAPPENLEDLVLPEYENLLVVENPASSSPGLAFLLATIDHFGETGDYTYLDFWGELRANGVLVTPGWEDAYYGSFTYASDGDRPIVVSYASSPPVEVYFAEGAFEAASSWATAVASARSSSSASCRAPGSGRWPRSGSTLCWARPSRRTSRSRCLSFPPTPRPSCPRSFASLPWCPKTRPPWRRRPSRRTARPGSRPGPRPCCARFVAGASECWCARAAAGEVKSAG